jgi:hypothetical protein
VLIGELAWAATTVGIFLDSFWANFGFSMIYDYNMRVFVQKKKKMCLFSAQKDQSSICYLIMTCHIEK